MDHAPGAFISSVLASSNIIEEVTGSSFLLDISSAVTIYNSITGDELVVDAAVCSRQKTFSDAVETKKLDDLTNALNSTRDKARMNSLGLPKA